MRIWPQGLKGALLLAVTGLVLSSSLLTAILASQRYTVSLRESLASQAENQARSLALQAADLVLINDLVGLQKLLANEQRSHSRISYIFVVRDGDILAHTFSRGVPAGLPAANALGGDQEHSIKEISSTQGARYLDIAWPIFEGRSGSLRIGLDEGWILKRIRSLWLEVGTLTLAILFPAIAGGVIFMRRITTPLGSLVWATGEMDKGRLDVRVDIRGKDEFSSLAESFNHMAGQLEGHTRRLKEQAEDLEQAHAQLSAAYEIIREVSSLADLEGIGKYLIGKFQGMLRCRGMNLLIFNPARNVLYRLSGQGSEVIRDMKVLKGVEETLAGLEFFKVVRRKLFEKPAVEMDFADAPMQAVVPLNSGGQLCGALVIACPGACSCDFHEADMVAMVLSHTTDSIMRAAIQEEELRDLKLKLDAASEYCGIVGKDSEMQLVFKLIEDVARTDATVLIQGESGTGKELAAKALHAKSHRRNKPFIVINCSAYPATLIESELFGHEKGSFTGAVRMRPGRFEQAHGGTIFLDEIGEIPQSAQVKLLRVLQTQNFERLGGEKTINVDVRILAATNKDLLTEVRRGSFREDLYYRLDVVKMQLPPLRERGNDIALLADHFLRNFAGRLDKDIDGFSPQAMRRLMAYHWPGNVRELQNVVEQTVILTRSGVIGHSDLPPRFQEEPESGGAATIREQEQALLVEALEETGWNKTRAAERLGIGRSTLYSKIKRYSLDKISQN